ncbi:MAG: hypothetical protein KDE47_34100, partial [Caldilineaceae bacterium]|nr:hypothetical protein [Caldilineaceae bacterium]
MRAGGAWVELIHDRLIEPVLSNNAAWRANLNLLQRQAELWHNEGHPNGLLLGGHALAEAEQWAAANSDELEEYEREFLQAAQEERRRQRVQRLMLIAISIFTVIAVISAIFAFIQRQEAVAQRAAAEDARAQEEVARVAAQAAEAVAVAAEATAVAQRNQALANESRLLAKEAQSQLTMDPVASLHLALAALPSAAQPRPYEPSAELALVQSVRSSLERGYLKLSTQPLVAEQVAIQPGGNWAAVGGGGLRLVKLDLTEVFTLATTATNFARVVWSADGNQLLSLESTSPGSLNNYTIRVWRDHQETAHHTFQEPIGCAEWDPDGAQIAICSGKTLWLMRADGTSQPESLADEFTQPPIGALWSTDARWLAAWTKLDTFMIWDRESGRPFYAHKQASTEIQAAAWEYDPDGEPFVAAIYGDGVVWFVSPNMAVIQPTSTPDTVSDAPKSRADSGLQKIDDAHFVTWGSSAVSRVWTNGDVIGDFGQADDNIQGVALSPSRAEILVFLANGSAKLWDISTMREVTQTQSLQAPLVTLRGHTKVIRSAAWRPDGKYIATTSADGAARIWDAQTGKSLGILRGHTNFDSQTATAEVFGAVWLNDRFLTTYGEDGAFRLWALFDAYGQRMICP